MVHHSQHWLLQGLVQAFTIMARTAIDTSDSDNLTTSIQLTKLLPQEQLNGSCNPNSALLSWQQAY